MRPPRGLSDAEARAWAALAATVTPLERLAPRNASAPVVPSPMEAPTASAAPRRSRPSRPASPPPSAPSPRATQAGLDSHWERRLSGGTLAPDFTLDLHDHSLDAAYSRLLGGLDLAREAGARVVLVIAGRERPVAAADRAGARGAIRAKLLDWLAASRHASAVAAVRAAHRRHGGEGALYIILKRAG